MRTALPDGDWVVVRGRRVWVADDPTWTPEDDFIEDELMDTLARNLAADNYIDLSPVTGDLCDDCGCLLAPAERCPSCLVWAIRDEQKWNQQATRRATSRRVFTHFEHRKAA